MADTQKVIHYFRSGGFLLVTDEQSRENETDLILGAAYVTVEKMNFLIRAGGLVCIAMTGQRLDDLQLPLMVSTDQNTDHFGTSFTISTDARIGTTTGISAADRTRTTQVLIDPNTQPADLARPGHLFPLRAASGLLQERRGHTETSIYLAQEAGIYPAVLLCELLNKDGISASTQEVAQFSIRYSIPIVSIADMP